MARKIRHEKHDDNAIGHGDRPWVYFMIDCFFLVTQFFVLTFHVKSDEVVLPQVLPPGGPNPSPFPKPVQSLTVHVSHVGPDVSYRFMNQNFTLSELTDALARVKQQNNPVVRVSYESAVPFGDVMAVFNSCTKLGVQKCGLIPLRSSDS